MQANKKIRCKHWSSSALAPKSNRLEETSEACKDFCARENFAAIKIVADRIESLYVDLYDILESIWWLPTTIPGRKIKTFSSWIESIKEVEEDYDDWNEKKRNETNTSSFKYKK